MRSKRTAKKNSTAKVVRVPWRIVEVRVRPEFYLYVRFADGTEGEVDVRPFLFARKPGVFERLRDPAEFAKAYLSSHGAVTWPGELDLAPDAMYNDIKATGRGITGRKPSRHV